MEEYPVSFQDYTVFHFDEPFEQTEYCKQLDQPLNSKSILILTKSKASLPRVKKPHALPDWRYMSVNTLQRPLPTTNMCTR